MQSSQTKSRKKKSPVLRWLRRNSVYLFLAAIFLAGVVVGVIIATAVSSAGAVSEVKNEPVVFVPQDSMLRTSDEMFQTLEYVSPPKPVETASEEVEPEYQWLTFRATAYCACERCCGSYGKNRPVDDDGKVIVTTASGKRAAQGVTIAADWSVLPCGTIVEVDGYGTYEVQDRGGAIKGNKIDVYFESHQEALEWGVKTVQLRIIKIGGEGK